MSPNNPIPQTHPYPSELLTATDVIRLLKIGRRTLNRLLARGEFPPPIRIGRLLRWRPEIVHNWLVARERGNGTVRLSTNRRQCRQPMARESR